jgi:hypothetical protein
VEATGQSTDEPAIESAQARAFDLAADDDELLAKEQVLGDQGCAGRNEGQDEVEQEAKEADHGSRPRTTMVCSWRGGRLCGAGWSGAGGGRGSGAATAQSPSGTPDQIQLTTEYLRPTPVASVRIWPDLAGSK